MTARSEWLVLRGWLAAGAAETSFPILQNLYFKRLATIFVSHNASIMDLAIATRDALRAAHANHISNPSLSAGYRFGGSNCVPETLGLFISSDGQVYLPREHVPEHLDAVYRLQNRRSVASATMDHSLSRKLGRSNFKHYLGLGQQAAVRAALLANDGRTIIVNLPTGCGKTLVAHALTAFSGQSGLTLVVVPTIALAIEQAQRARDLLITLHADHGGSYCWRSDLDQEEKRAIRSRVAGGAQRVLFCSPESVYRGLLFSLREAASSGSLKNIVVDEAHLIEQWGADFRPEFQVLSAVLERLDRESQKRIKKVFMSATMRESTIRLIDQLFLSKGEKSILVNGSFLRPEPSYDAIKASNENEHQATVLGQLLDLPRPLIVYCSTRQEVVYWTQQLDKAGFSRHAAFHGGTVNRTRAELIERWAKNDLDIMVATKAFGVGMDKPDIRSILRVSIPENLDLFYQEVGRAGRDGKACHACVVWHEGQKEVAKTLNRTKLISTDLGLKRWRKMWHNRQDLGDARYLVDLTIIHEELDQQSESNWEWNWKTLLLMQRSGFLETELYLENFEGSEDEQRETSANGQLGLMSKVARHLLVKNLNDHHSRSDAWADVIQRSRNKERRGQQQGHEEMIAWLENPRSCLCDRLRSFYEIRQYQPEYACGGCPGCRAIGQSPLLLDLGKSAAIENIPESLQSSREHLTRDVLPVFFGDDRTPQQCIGTWATWIAKLIDIGMVNAIRAEEEWLSLLDSNLPRGFGKFWVSLGPTDRPLLNLVELGIAFSGDSHVAEILSLKGHGIQLGDRRIASPACFDRRWFESNSSSIVLASFLQTI